MPPKCLTVWVVSCPGWEKPAVPWGGLKPGYGACQRALLCFALKQLLSNLCGLLQESVSSLVHCRLVPELLPQKAASLHPPLCLVWTHHHSRTAEKPACDTREGTCLWVHVGLEGRHRSLQCVSVAFSNGCLNWGGGDSLEKAAGGAAGSPWPERSFVSSICPVTEIRIQSAAGSSDGCDGSLSPVAITREKFWS